MALVLALVLALDRMGVSEARPAAEQICIASMYITPRETHPRSRSKRRRVSACACRITSSHAHIVHTQKKKNRILTTSC